MSIFGTLTPQPPRQIPCALGHGLKRSVFFMQNKAFIFTVLLSGLGTLLFGQKTQANSSFLPPNQVGTAYTPASFTATGGTAPDTFSALPSFLPPGMSLVTSGALSGIPTAEGSFGPVAKPSL